MIDDYDSPNVLAYRLTKPFKLGGSYVGNGVLYFVLQECNTEDSDNFDLHIANYYNYFPRETQDVEVGGQDRGDVFYYDEPVQTTRPPNRKEGVVVNEPERAF